MTKPEKKNVADAPQTAEQLNEEVKKQAEQAAPQAADNHPGVNELEAKLAEMKDALMRAVADAENTRKRAQKEVEDANRYGVSTFAKDLLSVFENLQRTIDSIPSDQANEGLMKNIYEGVDLTRKELANIFERRGILRVEPKPGEKFDHNQHQAIAQIEDPKFEQGAIIQVVQAGFIMHDRLLRPAMVTVSKGIVNNEKEHKLDTTA